MRGTIIFSFVFFAGFLVWRITERLSADALGLATGVILGILAGLPVALLLMAASRRREQPAEMDPHANPRGRLGMQHQQPPVIIVSGFPQGYAGNGGGHQMPGAYGMGQRALPPASDIVDSRQFHVVGEEDDGVEEW